MLDETIRRAGPFAGDGLKKLPFSFRVFEKTDVAVFKAASSNSQDVSKLVRDVDFTVDLNAVQEAAPGGVVTLTRPLATGEVAMVVSEVPYNQNLQLTNFSRFSPDKITVGLDRIVAQIQQLASAIDRCIKVGEIGSDSADDLKNMLLEARELSQKILPYVDAINLVMSDFTGTAELAFDHDYGVWGEDDTTVRMPVGGVLSTVAQNANDIVAVGRNVDDVVPVGKNIDDVVSVSKKLDDIVALALAKDKLLQAGKDIEAIIARAEKILVEINDASNSSAKSAQAARVSEDNAKASEIASAKSESAASSSATEARKDAASAKADSQSASASATVARSASASAVEARDAARLARDDATAQAVISTDKAAESTQSAKIASAKATEASASASASASSAIRAEEVVNSIAKDTAFVKTTPQTLTDAQKDQVASNLGLPAKFNEKFNKAGGAITGNLIIDKANAGVCNAKPTGYVAVYGGTRWQTGATLLLNGGEKDSGAGWWTLNAQDKSGTFSQLEGRPDGSLTLGGKFLDVIESAGQDYIRYKYGLQICWGEKKFTNISWINWGPITRTEIKGSAISFPVPFVSKPKVTVSPAWYVPLMSAQAVAGPTGIFDIILARPDAGGSEIDLGYIAIGYWK